MPPPHWHQPELAGELLAGSSGAIPIPALPVREVEIAEPIVLRIEKGNYNRIDTEDYIQCQYHPVISRDLFQRLNACCNLGVFQFIPFVVILKDYASERFGLLNIRNDNFFIDIERSHITKTYETRYFDAIFGYESLRFKPNPVDVDMARAPNCAVILAATERAKAILDTSTSRLFLLRDEEMPRRRW